MYEDGLNFLDLCVILRATWLYEDVITKACTSVKLKILLEGCIMKTPVEKRFIYIWIMLMHMTYAFFFQIT